MELYPLHKACEDGNVLNVANILSSSKHLLITEDPFKNWSPLHWAAYYGRLDCLQQLVSCEPSTLNIQSSKSFQTPLHTAAEGGQTQCLLWLLQAGVNPEVKDNLGEIALHKAAKVGSAECVSILVSTTTNIRVQNSNGMTASMLAEVSGHPNIASFIRQREMLGMSMFQNGHPMASLPLAPRLNRKRMRDMSDFENPFKRQRSIDLAEVIVPPLSIVSNVLPISGSVMEHEDLCGSEVQYSNSYMTYENMLRECHGC